MLLSVLFMFGCSNPTASLEDARKTIENKYPNIKISTIVKINQSFFEVKVGEEIYYLTSDLKHLIAGNIIEISSGTNLTEDSYKRQD